MMPSWFRRENSFGRLPLTWLGFLFSRAFANLNRSCINGALITLLPERTKVRILPI